MKEGKILSAGYKNFNIITFSWYVTNFCNYRCTYCNETTRLTKKIDDKEQNSYKVINLYLKHKKMKNFSVELIGGEPTLNPNLDKIIDLLDKNEKCIYVELITNLSKKSEYYLNLFKDKKNKFCLKPSFHPQYYNENYFNKILELKNKIYIKPTIIFSDNTKYFNLTCNFIDKLIDNGIHFDIQEIYNVNNFYKTKYNKKTIEKIKFYKNLPSEKKDEFTLSKISTSEVPYRFENGKKKVKYADILDSNLNKFYGYNCIPRYFRIEPIGHIFNSCTGEKLKFDLSNLENKIKCPVKEGCLEKHKNFYYKYV
tara:strand:- start:1020 stop:1952 length:933 start_codon:yes stop_codon:yes gene_type:complete